MGYKLRLAYLGDSAAQKVVKSELTKEKADRSWYNPANWGDDDQEIMMELYEEKCNEYVDGMTTGMP